MKKNLIALASKTTELAHKLIITKLEQNGISGIVPSHGSILHLLYSKQTVTMKEIAESINKTKPTVTVLIDKLIKQELVYKEKSDKDSRITYISLTKKGLSLEPIFQEVSKELNDTVYSDLSESEATQIETSLVKVIKALDQKLQN